MLDPVQRERFQELRRREAVDALAPEEQGELSALIQEIEDAEAAFLDPATERLARECEMLEAQNRELEALATRKKALRARLETMLAEAHAERQAIAVGGEHVGDMAGIESRMSPSSKEARGRTVSAEQYQSVVLRRILRGDQ